MKIHAVMDALTHLKHEATSIHTLGAVALTYIAVVVFTLKVFHFMRDRNSD